MISSVCASVSRESSVRTTNGIGLTFVSIGQGNRVAFGILFHSTHAKNHRSCLVCARRSVFRRAVSSLRLFRFPEVTVLGKKAQTKGFNRVTSATWDEKLHFRIDDATADELRSGRIVVDVRDGNMFTASEEVGRYVVDFESVYARPRHEFYRQWVGLIDNDCDGVNKPDERNSIRGYLLLRHAAPSREESRRARVAS